MFPYQSIDQGAIREICLISKRYGDDDKNDDNVAGFGSQGLRSRLVGVEEGRMILCLWVPGTSCTVIQDFRERM